MLETVNPNWATEFTHYEMYKKKLEEEFSDGKSVVHDHTWSQFVYKSAAKFPKMNVVHTHHGNANWRTPPPNVWFPRYMGVSRPHAFELEKTIGVPFRYVWNGINLPARSEMSTKDDGYLLSLNRISRFKGIHIAMDICTENRIPLVICLPPDSMVMCNPSVKCIQEVTCQDKVFTHNGRFMPVVETFEHNYTGNMICIKPLYHNSWVKCTPEHPVYIVRPEGYPFEWKRQWVNAKDVKMTDLLCFPVPRDNERVVLYTSDYVDNKSIQKNAKILPDKIVINDELLRLCGLYIAEGSADIGGINFAFSYTEKHLVAEVSNCVRMVFGVDCNTTNEHKNCISVKFNSRILSKLFKKWFGSGVLNKRIPNWIMELSKEQLKIVIDSMWEGDGSRSKTNPSSKKFKRRIDTYGTSSQTLAHQLFLCILKLGCVSTIVTVMNHGFGKRLRRPFYRISISGRVLAPRIIDGYALLGVRDIKTEEYSGNVYNIRVKDDNSYYCGLVTHNCGDDTKVEDQRYAFQCIERARRSGGLIKYYGLVDNYTKIELLKGCKAMLACPIERGPNNEFYIEAFGLNAVEANAYGKAALCLANGGHKDVVQHGVNGYLADNPRELAFYFDKISAIKPEDCRKRVEENFSVDTMTNSYMSIFEKIISGDESFKW